MKRIFFAFFFALLASGIIAQQTKIYTPTLVSPSDNAIDQMPDVFLDWTAVSGGFGLYYEVQLDTNSSFISPIIYTEAKTATNAKELLFGEKYYWRVRAIDNTDSSYWTAMQSFTVRDEVSLISPNDGAVSQATNVSLRWNAITGITYYDYQVDTAANFNSPFYLSGAVNNTASSVKLNQLLFGTKYYWKIRARHNLDTSMWSNVRSFTTVDTICSGAPTLVLPIENVVDEMPDVRLEWQEFAGAGSYKVYLDTTSLFSNPIVFTQTYISGSNRYINTQDLLFGKKYYWKVKAIETNDSSNWSTTRSFTVIDIVYLASPNDSAKNQASTVTLSWNSVTGTTYYDYEVDTTTSFNSPLLNEDSIPSGNSQINITSFLLKTKYYWRVRARHDYDSTLWSSIWSFNTLDTIPNSPELIFPVDLAIDQMPDVLLNWDTLLASSFLVQLDTGSSFLNPTTYVETKTFVNAQELIFGKVYYWRVKAVLGIDSSNWSVTRSFTVIDNVTQMLPADGAINQIPNVLLDWDDITGLSHYDYEIDTTSSFNSLLYYLGSVNGTTSQVITNILSLGGTEYYWRVRARHNTDTSSWSTAWTFTTLDTMPAIPNLVSPMDLAIDQMPDALLDWDSIVGATSYLVELDTLASFLTSDTLIATASFVNAQELLFGDVYYWRVKALNATDTSSWSTARSFTVIDIITLLLPADGAVNQEASVLLEWTKVTGITDYNFKMDTVSNFMSSAFTYGTIDSLSTQAIIDSLRFGTTYYWSMRAIHSKDVSSWATTRSFTVMDGLTLLSPANNAVDQSPTLLLRWNTVSGAIYYDCEIDTSMNFNSSEYSSTSVSANASPLQVIVSDLLFGAKYYWRVRAINGVDTSSWSTVWSFTIIDGINLIYPVDGAVDQMPNAYLRWTPVFTKYSYDYQIDTVANFSSSLLYLGYVNNNVPQVRSNELLFGTTYYWRVRPRNFNGVSSWSSVWSFTTVDKVKLTSPANATAGVSFTPKFTWKKITGTSYYDLQYDTSSSFTNPVLKDLITKQEFQVVGKILALTTYYWRVRVYHNKDVSGWSDTWSFLTDTATSIDPLIFNEFTINIYPNPTTGKAILELGADKSSKVQLSVMDILGKTVMDEDFYLKTGLNKKEINLEGLQEGIYLVKFQDTDKVYTRKIIVNK